MFPIVILSLIIHMGLYLALLWVAPAPLAWKRPVPVEVTYIDRTNPTKAHQIVTDTELGQLQDKLNEQAKYLSRLNRMVKKEMVARNSGLTKNRQPSKPSTTPRERPKPLQQEGFSINPQYTTSLPPGGLSTLSEYIPFVEEGAFTSLNTSQFAYYTFFARINEQIRNRWIQRLRELSEEFTLSDHRQAALKPRYSQVEIVLDQEGRIARASILQSSEVSDLDSAAIESFRRAGPFLNPPKGMIEQDGLIHLHYGFQVVWSAQHLSRQ